MNKITILPVLLAIAPLSACDSASAPAANTQADPASLSLADAMTQSPDVSGLVAAINEAGLSDIFSAQGGYTIIAPPNATFTDLTKDGDTPVPPAVLAGMLREHMLPGQLDLDAIRTAIADNGGKVSVRTMGSGMIEFALDGDEVVATHSESGMKAKLSGSGIQASNGALLLADAALANPPAAE